MRSKILHLLLPAAAGLSLAANAQQGLHIQNFSTGYPYVYSKDSLYVNIDHSNNLRKMCLINPSDKEWKYLNTTDYTGYTGPFVMKSPTEGVMIYSSQHKVYKTTDGWQTVTEVQNVANGFGLDQIVLTKAGYVGYESTLRDLYYSADGITWTNSQGVGSGGVNALRSFGNKVVLFRGFGYDAVSSDGGKTFDISKQLIATYSGTLRDIKLVSEDTIVVATDNNLYITHNVGTNWNTISYPSAVSSIVIKNANEMNIMAGMGVHYYTNDAGANWQQKTQLPNNSSLAGGFYIDNDLYLWPGYKSGDNGTTWTYFFPNAVHATDGWDVSFHESKGIVGRSGGNVGISIDKGRSFDYDVKVANSDVMAVKMLKNGDMLAGDRYGQAYYSTDGVNWNQRNQNIFTYNATKFSTSANDNVIVMSRLGQPLVSTDHGATFNVVSVGGGSHVQSVKPNGDIIDVVAKLDANFQPIGWEIFKVDPSGTKTSLETITTSDEALSDVHMASDNVGYLLTYNTMTKENKLYKTTNGWGGGANAVATMASLNTTSANYTNKTRMQTFGTDTLMLMGDGNKYYHYTHDGGTTWNKVDIDDLTKYNSFPSIQRGYFFNPQEYIFTLNASGLYLNTKEPVIPPINGIKNVNGKAIAKLDVYPNPSSSSIKLAGIEAKIADVYMYDLSGRLALLKGNHNMKDEVNVRDLPEGHYILTVRDTTGNTATARFLKQ
jgi:photosystem II stability/assembly factor-like uncharacterized protein